MAIQEIQGEDYRIDYDPESVTICFQGEMSLGEPTDYAMVMQLLNEIADQNTSTMTIDLRQLYFLNSSGISTLSKFVIGMRKKTETQLIVLGSRSISWQSKSLKNLQRLLPSLKLEVE
jgi:hypothetical protein